MQSAQRLWLSIKALTGHRQTRERLRALEAEQGALQAVTDAYSRGEYEAALEAAEGLRHGVEPTAAYCFYRGSALMQLGRVQEAEKWLRREVTLEDNNRRCAIGYTQLGDVLLRQQRYDEALHCYEASLLYEPVRSAAHRGMAEACLRAGRPVEAVQWARLAVEEARACRGGPPAVLSLDLGEALATLAWATAETSRDQAQVDRLVAEALPLLGPGYVSSLSQVHYHAGLAYAALGDAATRERHFEEAARIDPHGILGREAGAQL